MTHRSFLLELTPERFRPRPLPTADLNIARAAAGDESRARFLWTEVGRDYWAERIRWSGARWRRHLSDAAVSFWIASCSEQDIGFFELRMKGTSIKLEGFGLLSAWRGKGLGGALLSAATQHAFATGARRIWLHTATDDHPNALPNYEARGYRVYRQTELRNPMPPQAVARGRLPGRNGA